MVRVPVGGSKKLPPYFDHKLTSPLLGEQGLFGSKAERGLFPRLGISKNVPEIR